jgi:DNA-binding transcriptional MerR regulator
MVKNHGLCKVCVYYSLNTWGGINIMNENFDKKNLMSMKEFSTITGIEQTTLRYWDEIGLFSPTMRNPNNGYRYYSSFQIVAINFISVLSSLGIPLKSIDSIKTERSPEKIAAVIDEHEKILDLEMCRLMESYMVMHERRNLIRMGLQDDESKIYIRELGDTPIVFGPYNDFENGNTLNDNVMKFSKDAKLNRINLNYSIGGFYESMDAFSENPEKPLRFFAADPTGTEKRPAGKYLIGYTRGFYGCINDLPARMNTYALSHNLKFVGPVYVIYLHDELSISDPSQYLARVTTSGAYKCSSWAKCRGFHWLSRTAGQNVEVSTIFYLRLSKILRFPRFFICGCPKY